MFEFNFGLLFIYWFYYGKPKLINDIKLNPDTDKVLECKNIIGMKRCKVTQEHFKGIYGIKILFISW